MLLCYTPSLLQDGNPKKSNSPSKEDGDLSSFVVVPKKRVESSSSPNGGDDDVGKDDSAASDASAPVYMVKSSCGDAHNLGLDSCGQAYSLPSPLDFSPELGGGRHRVTDVVCGKEHCLLLTEHGQVFSWGGGSRGQLGHGCLTSEERPRLVQALDGVRATRVEAGGWHSAVVTQFQDLYMFGWNESGQLAQVLQDELLLILNMEVIFFF